MATTFTKGQEVKLRAVLPQGAIQAFRMDEDGVVYCLIVWTDADGNEQSRWFAESELVAVE
jgi:uncharacterized protein YodC (DUF2158 family)